MKLDSARWPASWVPAIPAMIIALLAVLVITGVLHGTAGGLLVALGMGAFGAIVWRADGIAWFATASWTVPLSIWVLVAWVAFSEVPFLAAGLAATAWFAAFIFWLPPVRLWYRWVLREDFPWGRGGRSVAQLYGLDMAIGRALNQYNRDADTARLHQRCEELRSEAQALTTDEPGSSEARTLLLVYLESLHSVAADPWNQPQPAFEALNQQLQEFRDALKLASSIPP